MGGLVRSFVRFSTALTLFGIEQLRDSTEMVVDASRWTLFTAFTCPDCGTQQEPVRRFHKILDAASGQISSQLGASQKETYESIARAATGMAALMLNAADAILPVRDDGPPPEGFPALPRGSAKRSALPLLDPRRFSQMAEDQFRILGAQLDGAKRPNAVEARE